MTLANVEAPSAIAADEPIAREFSLERATRYLDTAALSWIKKHDCAACHTLAPYMMSRSAAAGMAAPAPEVRAFLEDITTTPDLAFPAHLPPDGRIAIVVNIAVGLSLNDRLTTQKLQPITRQALDRMWESQRADGGWDWPFRDVPPIKDSEHYGVTFAALGVGLAPEGYAQTEAARRGLGGIRKYLQSHPPTTLHERAMLLWVSQSVAGIQTDTERKQTVDDLLAAQRPDGGWSMASLVENPQDAVRQSDKGREARGLKGHGSEFAVFVGRDHVYQMPLTSDGYSTGFAIYVARQAGIAAADARLQEGIAWLKTHQRVSGRWFTPSLGFHRQNLISNAGTGYAIMALHSCTEVP